MGCVNLSTPEEQVRQLTARLRAFTKFALAHQEWEGMILCDDGPWFDQMPGRFQDKFEEVQALRNKACGF